MKMRLLAITIFLPCLLVVGQIVATANVTSNLAPASYLPLVRADSSVTQTATPTSTPTATPTATPTTTPTTGNAVGIAGSAFVNPRWRLIQASSQPIAYEIILDVTGSMSYDFAGHGTLGGTDYQCLINNPSDPLPFIETCTGGVDTPWRTESERRIYIAKNAIFNFINKMNSNDIMRIIAFSDSQSGNASTSAAWSSNKSTLIQYVRDAGKYNNDPYRTSGEASSAQALNTAQQILLSVPPTAPNGQPYQVVAIFLTDSVANVFLDGTLNTARDVCSNLSVFQALNTPYPCQVGVTAAGKKRPISAMITEADSMKAANPNLPLYVIALDDVPQTGLDRVASSPSLYYQASQPGLLDDILTQINAQVVATTCTPAGGNQWVDTIDSAHTPSNPPFNLPAGTFGYVYIYDPNAGVPLYTLPIQNDPVSNTLSFSIPPPDPNNPNRPGIAPGTYEMEAYLGYKGEDGISRQYDWFIDQNTLSGASRVQFQIIPSSDPGQVVPVDAIYLDLRPTARLCP